ncbi:hypothetical protein [Microcoleus sp. BROC3]|uniref:hypothetical protein n=1 Tax=Microcoleus sp. BROC3 TaxID=3055323 RepID=UPI002FD0C07C
METDCGADTCGDSGVAVGDAASGGVAGNATSGVSDAVGVAAGDTTSGGVGDAASFVPKTNSSIALPSGLRFLVLISTLP